MFFVLFFNYFKAPKTAEEALCTYIIIIIVMMMLMMMMIYTLAHSYTLNAEYSHNDTQKTYRKLLHTF